MRNMASKLTEILTPLIGKNEPRTQSPGRKWTLSKGTALGNLYRPAASSSWKTAVIKQWLQPKYYRTERLQLLIKIN